MDPSDRMLFFGLGAIMPDVGVNPGKYKWRAPDPKRPDRRKKNKAERQARKKNRKRGRR